jgi:hypothetical protein
LPEFDGLCGRVVEFTQRKAPHRTKLRCGDYARDVRGPAARARIQHDLWHGARGELEQPRSHARDPSVEAVPVRRDGGGPRVAILLLILTHIIIRPAPEPVVVLRAKRSVRQRRHLARAAGDGEEGQKGRLLVFVLEV